MFLAITVVNKDVCNITAVISYTFCAAKTTAMKRSEIASVKLQETHTNLKAFSDVCTVTAITTTKTTFTIKHCLSASILHIYLIQKLNIMSQLHKLCKRLV